MLHWVIFIIFDCGSDGGGVGHLRGVFCKKFNHY